jgi:hypothetical protein
MDTWELVIVGQAALLIVLLGLNLYLHRRIAMLESSLREEMLLSSTCKCGQKNINDQQLLLD